MANAFPFVHQAIKRERQNDHLDIARMGNKVAAIACKDGLPDFGGCMYFNGPAVPRSKQSLGSAASCLHNSEEEKTQYEGTCDVLL